MSSQKFVIVAKIAKLFKFLQIDFKLLNKVAKVVDDVTEAEFSPTKMTHIIVNSDL